MGNKENKILPIPKSPEEEQEKIEIDHSEQDEAALEGAKMKKGLESMIKDLAKKPSEGLKKESEEPEEKAEAKPEVKAEAKAEVKAEAKAEVKAEAKPEAKPEAKAEVKAEAKAEVKAEAKPEAKAETKPEAKPEAKAEAKPEAKAETEPASEEAPKKGILQKLAASFLVKGAADDKDEQDEDEDTEEQEEAAGSDVEKKTPRGLFKVLMRDPSKVFGKNSDEDAEDQEEELAEKEEIQTQLAVVKKKIGDTIQKNRLVVLLGGILILVFLLYYMIHSQTYDKISVLQTTTISGAVNCNYTEFDGGVIKYSQDGLAYLSIDGTEKWNQPYQIANPFVELNGKTGAVADKNGTSIVVFQKTGVLGQIETNLPIERISVSKQGIVCAVLQNEDSTMVICYDCVGNVLVEHKTSFSGTGYPLDVALSDNGETLMVDYLYAAEGIITTRIAFYNFGEAGQNIADHLVADFTYPGTISASCFYMDKTKCVAVGDDKIIYFDGSDEPKELSVVELEKEIKNLSYDNEYIGLVLKNDKDSGYEARMYDADGVMVMTSDFAGEYNNVKMCDEQLLMYDGKQCSVILKNGVQKFKGEMDNPVLEMIPQNGVNRYLLLDADGIKKIRFVK